jgi:hypothetical protein
MISSYLRCFYFLLFLTASSHVYSQSLWSLSGSNPQLTGYDPSLLCSQRQAQLQNSTFTNTYNLIGNVLQVHVRGSTTVTNQCTGAVANPNGVPVSYYCLIDYSPKTNSSSVYQLSYDVIKVDSSDYSCPTGQGLSYGGFCVTCDEQTSTSTTSGDGSTSSGTTSGDGSTTSGDGSTTSGSTTTSGDGSTTSGTTTGDGSTTSGSTTTSGDGSTTSGTTTGDGSTSTGDGSTTTGDGSTTSGDGSTTTTTTTTSTSTSSGGGSTSTGDGSTTSGDGSTSTGDGSTTTGDGSTSTGDGSTTSGDGSTSTGDGSTTTGDGSTTTGDGSTTTGDGSTTTGDGSTGSGDGSGEGSSGSGGGSGQGDGSGQGGTDDDGEGNATAGAKDAFKDRFQYPEIKADNFYKREKKPIKDIWEENKDDFKQTALLQALESLKFPDSGGSCPAWTISLWQLGDYSIAPDCWVFDAIRAIIIVTAIFTARRLIFGG